MMEEEEANKYMQKYYCAYINANITDGTFMFAPQEVGSTK